MHTRNMLQDLVFQYAESHDFQKGASVPDRLSALVNVVGPKKKKFRFEFSRRGVGGCRRMLHDRDLLARHFGLRLPPSISQT